MLTVTSEAGVSIREVGTGRAPSEDLAGYRVVRPGDLVVNRLWARFGAYGVSNCAGLISPAYWVMRVNAELAIPRFVHHLLRSGPYRVEIGRLSKNMPPNGFDLPWEQFKWLPIPTISVQKQRRIADFLDDQVTRIDAAIRAREVQAGLLRERWGAMLAREYSDGGTPGDLQPLKRVAWWREGPGILLEDFRDAGTPLLRIVNVRGQQFSLDGCGYVDSLMAKRRWGHLAVRAGELLTSGSATGGLAVEVPPEAEGSIPYTGLIRIRPASPNLLKDFLRFFLLSPPFTEQVNALKTGIGIQHWGPYHLAQVSISVPDTRKQAAVVDRLGDGQHRVSAALAAVDSSSRLLQARKRSLITAAVTGEFDVSSAGPRAAAAVTG